MIYIAYCPTMERFAKMLSPINEIQMIPMPSAGQSLAAHKAGKVQGVLIGRYAKSSEIDTETYRVILQGGYTLIYHIKTGIWEQELEKIRVYTYLPEETIQAFQSVFGEIKHYDSLDACLHDQLETPVLIDWKDYRDEFELLIPMNEHGKVPLFRAPVLYFKEIPSTLIEEIKTTIQ